MYLASIGSSGSGLTVLNAGLATPTKVSRSAVGTSTTAASSTAGSAPTGGTATASSGSGTGAARGGGHGGGGAMSSAVQEMAETSFSTTAGASSIRGVWGLQMGNMRRR
jgi:hypothetical protein